MINQTLEVYLKTLLPPTLLETSEQPLHGILAGTKSVLNRFLLYLEECKRNLPTRPNEEAKYPETPTYLQSLPQYRQEIAQHLGQSDAASSS